MKNLFEITVFLLVLISFTTNAQNQKPNFLFIITDDQTNESIQALGNTEIETPNLDKLVSEGVTFTHAFNQGSWSGAVCVASRSMLITGQTVFRVKKNKAYLPSGSEKDKNKIEVALWPEVMSKNGYKTFVTGKWHNSGYALLKGFDTGNSVSIKGYLETYDANGSSKIAYNRTDNKDWQPWNKTLKGQWTPIVKNIIYNEKNVKKLSALSNVNQHSTAHYTDKAINYLMNDAKKSNSPFFMYVAFNAPHDPRQAPKEFVDKYPSASIKIPENYLEEHPFDQGERYTLRDEKIMPFPRTKKGVQLHRSEYYAAITYIDSQLGRILEALENSGKAKNTYVIFTSDHGLAVGQHGLMGKQNQYDHSIRMPLIIKGPNLEKGKQVNTKVYMQSIYATTCDLAAIETPKSVEFKSFNNLLKGYEYTKEEGEEYVFGSYKKFQRMIRSDKFKLIVYPKANKIQLFDLIKDPKEIHNLASNRKYKKIKKELYKQLQLKQEELDDDLDLTLIIKNN
ncbi:sulfatase-like hydrolase/transferase [Polaribacter staleyi]|uniref:sulfatase-like hydrolase/transferase n=1 Tax=Polaribacter staleyi TaxID=2022337 RepID=UPI0031BB4EBE